MSRATVNKVFLLGSAGRDGEISFTKGGVALGVLSIATNRSVRTSDGYAKVADWHRIKAFGPLGERLASVKKGAHVFVEAELQYSRWTDKNNVVRYSNDIIAKSVELLAEHEDRAPEYEAQGEEPPVHKEEPS